MHQTLKNIDWPIIAQKICFFSKFNITKEHITRNPLPIEEANLDNHLSKVDELFNLISQDIDINSLAFGNVSDTPENHFFINNLVKNVTGDFKQLNFACALIENISELKNTLKTYDREDLLFLIEKTQRLRQKFVKSFRGFVDKDGHANLEKHPLLSAKIQERNNLEAKIREEVHQILKSEDIEKRLQFSSFDIINDRYVIPIRSDSYNGSIGIIVSRSSTGSTLFVEPTSVREYANKRMQIIAVIDEIINKICQDFTDQLKSENDILIHLYSFFLQLDYCLTQAKFSYQRNFVRPEISLNNSEYIENFFHPLIENCRPNTIDFKSFHHGMIISGPNTGGKTVSIKSIVLCHVFMKLGFFVPATRAKLRPVQDIFYFDSDYQDLSHGLSSFAGETTAILQMLAEIKPNSLVAADEIFNSTGSDEASSLAISIINHLTQNLGAMILISTHHQLLKTTMQENSNYISAHVGYDFENNIPTFNLIVGTPGSSMALTIFERLSHDYYLDKNILQNAKSILDKKYITYEKLLQDLSQKKAELDGLLIDNRDLNNQLKNQRKSMEGVLFLEKQKLYEQYKSQMEKQVRKIQELKEDKDITVKQKQRKATEFKSIFNSQSPIQDQTQVFDVQPIEELIEGKTYFSELLKNDCVLISVSRTKATVSYKGKQIIVPTASLYTPLNNTPKTKPSEKVRINIFQSTAVSSVTVNGRGMRLEKFQSEVLSAILSLQNGDLPYLLVVHGHGDGVLKKWLRDYLKREKDLTWSPEEGNDGCTKIEVSQSL